MEEKKDWFWSAVVEGRKGGAEKVMEKRFRVGARNAVYGVEMEMEIWAGKKAGDAREVEDRLEQTEIIFCRRNDLHREGRRFHREGEGSAACVDGDLGEVGHLQLRQNLGV